MLGTLRLLSRKFGMLAAAGTIALAVGYSPALAGGGHRHHHGGAFFSFGVSSAPYYYDPYPYGPVYAYPPVYDYAPPPYAYDNGPAYDEGPDYYSDSGSDSGPYCREFQTTVVIDGQPQSAHGTACQQPDGTWAVVR